MKASDITDEQFLDAVRACESPRGSHWADRWAVTERLGFPEKVVLAKARRLIKRGVIDGCYCGCRGDWTTDLSAMPARS